MVKKSEDLFFRNKMLEKRKKQGKGAYNMKMSNY